MKTPDSETDIQKFLQNLNQSFLNVHREKEDSFWAAKMGYPGTDAMAFPTREKIWQEFVSDPRPLEPLRMFLNSKLSVENQTVIRGWIRFFESHAMENTEAKSMYGHMVDAEEQLQISRGAMNLGYIDPNTQTKIPASSVKLGLVLRTAPEETLRKAAHQGLHDIANHVLRHGFLDIVRERNRMGKLLGYEDYYDFKVWRNEGFSKKKLFEVLEDLERSTREPARQAALALEKKHGAMARRGWNFAYLTSGDVTKKMDPYFDFGTSLSRWGRSFAGLGIRYRGATLNLDLLDRKGKYENGFMHGPVPAWMNEDQFKPARIQFTANAIPGQSGSGQRATETLFHEGGHAAHFSNICMPAPCFAQEYAPSSVAFAETQSMFLDRLVETPEWQARYARNSLGHKMPSELVLENLKNKHPIRAFQLRAMLTVCFAERALYELPEASLSAENVLRVFGEIEQEMQFLNEGVRPVLSVPHLLSWESSAYYHGYVLAEMAVNQTRRYFLKRDGAITDNSSVGSDLANHYWQPGNSKTFFELVEGLTGEPFSATATSQVVAQPIEEAAAEAKADLKSASDSSGFEGRVDLDAHIRVLDGPVEIASNAQGSFASMAETFSTWIESREKN